jgi:hypothetical protein
MRHFSSRISRWNNHGERAVMIPSSDACYPNSLIELYVVDGIRDEAERDRVRSHLAGCPACRAVADEAEAFHQMVGSVPSDLIDRVVRLLKPESPVRPKVPGRIVSLSPAGDAGRGPARTLLAADSGAAARFEPVQTYTNVEADVVARLLRDNVSRSLALYLVEAGDEPFEDRVLEIEGRDERFPADASGRVDLAGLSEGELRGRTIRIHSSIAVFDLEPAENLRERIRFEGHYALRNADFDEIRIETEEAEGRTITRIRVHKIRGKGSEAVVGVSVSRRGDAPLTSPAVRGVAVFEQLDLERVLKIRIY